MSYKKLFSLLFVVLLLSCHYTKEPVAKTNFDKQAHRGGRGLMPENTIASEKKRD